MTERTYVAFYCGKNSFVRGEFRFESCHRAGSKANYDDFARQFRCKRGRSALLKVDLDSISISLDK